MNAAPVPAAGRNRALWVMIADIAAPIAVYYGMRGAGASVWLALVCGAIFPAAGAVAGLLWHRRVDTMGLLVLATLAASAILSLTTGSPRALLARDGLITGAWAAYMYLSLLASGPATFIVSRPLLEGRRVYDPATRGWVRPAATSWDELWQGLPRFRRIWRVCTVIWGTAILADAIIRVIMAYTLPVGVVPGLGGALWPVTFIALQVVTNVYFYRSGFWRILRDGHDRAAAAQRHRYGTGVGTNLAMAPATAAGLSIMTHVLAPGTETSVALGKSDASRCACAIGKKRHSSPQTSSTGRSNRGISVAASRSSWGRNPAMAATKSPITRRSCNAGPPIDSARSRDRSVAVTEACPRRRMAGDRDASHSCVQIAVRAAQGSVRHSDAAFFSESGGKCS